MTLFMYVGGAERDAALLGLQVLGHSVDIYTSHHGEKHCFDETRDGGKFHILFAHARQLHLAKFLLSSCIDKHDVFFVDQLSTCILLLRLLGGKRVVFYCHFPNKLLANGAFVEGKVQKKNLEKVTTDSCRTSVIPANLKFTLEVVYPAINIHPYEASAGMTDPDIFQFASPRPALLSVNRFEMKKNAALAIEAFVCHRGRPTAPDGSRLVLAGGYDPRLEDNIRTLNNLIDLVARVLSFPDATSHTEPGIFFLLNFTTGQRSALLYTLANQHFGIRPVEGMICGLPVLVCDSGGPTESIVDMPSSERTGWLQEIFQLSEVERAALISRCKDQARSMFGMEAMAKEMDSSLCQAVDMGAVLLTPIVPLQSLQLNLGP
ncbi:glycosyltransferase family 4 protein [Pisolithus marmoratus]|nr:glycosyltransferase family 4 protein [Pisolithus marmoratus]